MTVTDNPTNPNRRESMVAAAAELLDAGGRAAVTLREVGRLTGVSHNAPYRHFANKDDLLGAIAGRELELLIEKALIGSGGDVPEPGALMLDYLRWAIAYPARFRLASAPWEKVNAELLAAATRWRTLVIASVAQAQSQGRLPAGDAERMSSQMLALAHGAAHLALAGHLVADGKGAASPEDVVNDHLELLARDAGASHTKSSRAVAPVPRRRSGRAN